MHAHTSPALPHAKISLLISMFARLAGFLPLRAGPLGCGTPPPRPRPRPTPAAGACPPPPIPPPPIPPPPPLPPPPRLSTSNCKALSDAAHSQSLSEHAAQGCMSCSVEDAPASKANGDSATIHCSKRDIIRGNMQGTIHLARAFKSTSDADSTSPAQLAGRLHAPKHAPSAAGKPGQAPQPLHHYRHRRTRRRVARRQTEAAPAA